MKLFQILIQTIINLNQGNKLGKMKILSNKQYCNMRKIGYKPFIEYENEHFQH